VRSEGFYVNEVSTDTSWDRTRDLPICSTAPYPLCYRGPPTYINDVYKIIDNDAKGVPFGDNTSIIETTSNQERVQTVKLKYSLI